jgi:arylsulfatase A
MKITLLLSLVGGCLLSMPSVAAPPPPNVVIIFCDDLGWGDLGVFGNPTIKTPNLDRMAAEGQKWTQFYVASPVCTPSRAALMTGRYPIRNGMTSAKRVVLFPNSGGGLPPTEVTLAELLKQKSYATACFGKWHLGHLPQFLPTSQGFDTYYGIPYSNDMDSVRGSPNYRQEAHNDPNYFPAIKNYNVPLMKDEEIIERPADQTTITRRYTEKAIDFIRENRSNPFFVYLPHSLPHIPLFASDSFRSSSKRGLYGDVIQEIDWCVGQVTKTLTELGLEKNTLVMFSSDNGPWLSFNTHGGSAGPLRAGKGTTFEGGQRVPTIFWWPGKIKGGEVITEMGSTMDMMATLASLTGTTKPTDRKLDSHDLSPALLGTGKSPRTTMAYWTRAELHAYREGPWKLHIKQREPVNYGRAVELDAPELYHVEHDISEKYNVAAKHPGVTTRLLAALKKHQADIDPVPDQLIIPMPK